MELAIDPEEVFYYLTTCDTFFVSLSSTFNMHGTQQVTGEVSIASPIWYVESNVDKRLTANASTVV